MVQLGETTGGLLDLISPQHTQFNMPQGTEIAEWLNSLGVTGIVLKYRCVHSRLNGFVLYVLVDRYVCILVAASCVQTLMCSWSTIVKCGLKHWLMSACPNSVFFFLQ